ncbi:MAG: hypothetical protein AB1762_19145 [Gemmatimonadota bacterium]
MLPKREKKMGFAEYVATKSLKGRVSLRRKQMQLALQGDRTMLVWLGKNLLCQKDKHRVDGELSHKGEVKHDHKVRQRVVVYLPDNGRDKLPVATDVRAASADCS